MLAAAESFVRPADTDALHRRAAGSVAPDHWLRRQWLETVATWRVVGQKLQRGQWIMQNKGF